MQRHPLSNYEHAIKRAWQRYGAALHPTDIKKLEKQIWNGSAQWFWDHPETVIMRQCYKVKHQHKYLVCVFDIRADRIITFLPQKGIFDYE